MSTQPQQQDEKSRIGIIVAGVLTVLWVLLCCFLLFQDSVFGLTLNAFGDFVGGVIGPVALLWIVVGVWQQAEDLKLQKQELRRHVEATERLVSVDRELLDHEREVRQQQALQLEIAEQKAKPRFGYRSARKVQSTKTGDECRFHFENLGGPFRIIEIEADQNKRVSLWGTKVTGMIYSGEMPYFDVSPLQPKERIRFVLAISWGNNHIGKMEIVGDYGSTLMVNLEQRV